MALLEILNRPHADSIRLPLAIGAYPVILILSAYMWFVLKLGRQFMSQRIPFKLQRVLKIYNLIQIIYNGGLAILSVYFIFIARIYNLRCIIRLSEDHPFYKVEVTLFYLYYLNKILDLLDTVFFVLRKSYRQITVLHIMHHAYMVGVGYLVLRFHGYGGHLAVTGLLNTIVHTIMYTYYYFTSQHPSLRNYLWIKKYITIMQLVQFLIIGAHNILTLTQSNCAVSRPLIYVSLAMCFMMIVMFSNFYVHEYILPKKPKSHNPYD